jgi:membrane-associated phospholipid phosphatase
MESVLEFGLEATAWLQANYPQLEQFMITLSQIGQFEFYLAVLPFVYWSLNKQLGLTMTYLLAIADLTNAALKHPLRGPRPYWFDPSLGLSAEDSYGLPSGHAQTVTVAYLYLAAWARQRWVWILCSLMVFFMILSRVYLGVHFVHDVIVGFLMGALVLIGYFVWQHYLAESFKKRIMGQRLLAALALPLGIGLLYVLAMLILGAPNEEVSWAAELTTAERTSIENVATAVATLLGLGIGFVLESSRVRFLTDGPIWKRIARYVLGIVGVLLIWRGLGLIFPRDPLWLAIPLRMVRYLLLGLWAAYYAPAIFVRLGLAEARPAPQIDMKI